MENGFHPHRPIFGDGSLSPTEQDHGLLHDDNPINSLSAKADEAASIHHENLGQEERQRTKRKRASKACDACRVRKVKCDSTRNPCPQCAEHSIPCLFTVPVRRRGPPNAYVEAQRAKMELEAQGISYDADQPTLPTNGLYQHGVQAAQFGLFASSHDKGLEELATPVILNLVFDDFFKYVYPLAPIIIESAFRRVLGDSTLHTNDFLALSASILGYTLACLRSSESQYGGLTVEHTYQFATSRLGINYRDRINLEIVATLQYLALASAHLQTANTSSESLVESTRAQILASECASFVTTMQLNHNSSMNFMQRQLLQRMLYFLPCLLLQAAPQPVKLSLHLAMTPDTPAPLLDKLFDLTDEEMDQATALADHSHSHSFKHSDEASSTAAKSYIPGALQTRELYVQYAETLSEDKSHADFSRQDQLVTCFRRLRALDVSLPAHLRIAEESAAISESFEVQKINYHVTKSFLCYLLLNRLAEIQSILAEEQKVQHNPVDITFEQRAVITETLALLKTSRQRPLEANGIVLVRRLRQIASPLVEIIHSDSAEEGDVDTARTELTSFMEILESLDRTDDSVVLELEN